MFGCDESERKKGLIRGGEAFNRTREFWIVWWQGIRLPEVWRKRKKKWGGGGGGHGKTTEQMVTSI